MSPGGKRRADQGESIYNVFSGVYKEKSSVIKDLRFYIFPYNPISPLLKDPFKALLKGPKLLPAPAVATGTKGKVLLNYLHQPYFISVRVENGCTVAARFPACVTGRGVGTSIVRRCG